VILVSFLALAQSAPVSNEGEATVSFQNARIEEDGAYKYDFGTSNGIEANVEADSSNLVNGEYSYKQDDGSEVRVAYIAGEGLGFQPLEGVHPSIIAAIKYIVDHPPEDSVPRLDKRLNEGGFKIPK